MKKIISLLAVTCTLIIMAVTLSGCNTTKSYTYNVETGDKIKITLKTNDKYDMTSDLPVEFIQDGTTIAHGTFAKKEAFETYLEVVRKDSKSNIIEENSNKDIEYVFYEYDAQNHKEYNYIIKIKDSNTCFILGNIVSRKSVQDVFKRITFEVVD